MNVVDVEMSKFTYSAGILVHKITFLHQYGTTNNKRENFPIKNNKLHRVGNFS